MGSTTATSTSWGSPDLTDVTAAKVPYNDTIGLSFDSIDENGSPVWRFEPTAEAIVDPDDNVIHGGAIAGCIEFVAAHAVYEADRAGGDWAPADMRVDFHGWVAPGSYRVRGKALRVGKQLAIGEAQIERADDPSKVVASGRVMLSRIPA